MGQRNLVSSGFFFNSNSNYSFSSTITLLCTHSFLVLREESLISSLYGSDMHHQSWDLFKPFPLALVSFSVRISSPDAKPDVRIRTLIGSSFHSTKPERVRYGAMQDGERQGIKQKKKLLGNFPSWPGPFGFLQYKWRCIAISLRQWGWAYGPVTVQSSVRLVSEGRVVSF